MEEGKQYSEYSVESTHRAYMTMRDYRNLAWQNQQPWERNPNPPRSMRDYRDQGISAPSYMVPPQYTSTPQPPQPPQLISPIVQAILDLTKLVGDAMGEQKKFNAQLSQKIYTVENPLEQTLDGFQSELGQQFDNLQCSISKLAQQLDHKGEENSEDEWTETILAEQAQLRPQEELKVESVEAPPEELQDAPQLGLVYGPRKKEEEILPLLSEESNGKEAWEEPQKSTDQPQNSPLPVYILSSPAPKPTSEAPTTKASLALPVLKSLKKLVAFVQNFATTPKKMAAAHIAWHSGWFGCRFGFGAPEPRHF